ncbi:serine O-acetyltransferase EpsC [Lysinibacter sp. HNR]|uniref:serine O-acetyltransferase EpsC n=1 Tax=Lysinibacter sp. HNR TaxID=3031408 RepID=UPI00243490DD|nr:serine O-acetyltransferase EpsC [Lysinibacter sp. HNR]WGD36620.1 serine O-acetyltransferase [Lysinibacter sp. HNR]
MTKKRTPRALFPRLHEDILAAKAHDPAARSSIEVFFTYSGVHAVFWHRISHRLWRIGFKFIARVLAQFTRWITGIEIHPGATLGHRVFIDHGMGVVIGETAIVGNDVMLYHGVTLGGTTSVHSKRHPTVGNRVMIGAGAKLLGNITIGEDSVVGANAVVVKDAPARSLLVGIPATVRPRKMSPSPASHGSSDESSDASAIPDQDYIDPAIFI